MEGKTDGLTRKDLEIAVRAALENTLTGVGEKLLADMRQELRQGFQEISSLKDCKDFGGVWTAKSAEKRSLGMQVEDPQPHALEAWTQSSAEKTSLGMQVEDTQPITLEAASARQLSPRGAEGEALDGYLPLIAENDLVVDFLAEDFRANKQGWLNALVTGSRFEAAAGLLVVINAVFIGAETNSECMYRLSHPPVLEEMAFNIGEVVFMCLFLTEWMMRVCVYGKAWFVDDRWYVAWFDTFMIGAQVLDQVCALASVNGAGLGDLTMIRCLRLLRILRLVRLAHLFRALGTIVDSIVAAASSLFWAMILLATALCVCSVIFARLTLVATGPSDRLRYYFGSVPRTYLTLLEAIIGGISWDEPVMILINEVSVISGVCFSIYVSLGLFVMLNITTAVFVDKAMKAAAAERLDQAIVGIERTFEEEIKDGREISMAIFTEKLALPDMQLYLDDMNLSVDEAPKLFHIMDKNNNGTVSSSELMAGLAQLKSTAKTIDVEESTRVQHRHHKTISESTNVYLASISEKVDNIAQRLSVTRE